jgi:hypothetical protein
MKQIALIFVTMHLLFSCSLHYHLNKAVKKGYKCEEVSDTIKITSVDSFPVIVHDSIVWEKVFTQKDTIIRYKTSYVPRTRYETKLAYRYKTKYIKAEAQKVKYQNKYITKYKIRWGLVIVAFILGFILRSLLSQTIKFYLNKFL